MKEKATNLMIMDWFFSSAKQKPNERRKDISEAILTSNANCKKATNDSSTSHHLIISSICYSINMRAILSLLLVRSENFISINRNFFKGIDSNQNWTCFTLWKETREPVKDKQKGDIKLVRKAIAWPSELYPTHINQILSISVLNIMKHRRFI
jgi:hypothetical protein